MQGDALVEEDVAAAFEQIEDVDAVVSTIGGTPADPSADSEGNINLIKVSRFALRDNRPVLHWLLRRGVGLPAVYIKHPVKTCSPTMLPSLIRCVYTVSRTLSVGSTHRDRCSDVR